MFLKTYWSYFVIAVALCPRVSVASRCSVETTGWIELVGMETFFDQSLKKFGCLQNNGISINFVPNSERQQISPRHIVSSLKLLST